MLRSAFTDPKLQTSKLANLNATGTRSKIHGQTQVPSTLAGVPARQNTPEVMIAILRVARATMAEGMAETDVIVKETATGHTALPLLLIEEIGTVTTGTAIAHHRTAEEAE